MIQTRLFQSITRSILINLSNCLNKIDHPVSDCTQNSKWLNPTKGLILDIQKAEIIASILTEVSNNRLQSQLSLEK